MKTEKYIKHDYTIPIETVIKQSRAILVCILLLFIPFILVWGYEEFKMGAKIFIKWYSLIPTIILGTVLHELLHGLAWVIAGRIGFDKISYGFQLKTFTPYVHCKAILQKWPYIFGLAAPLVLLGILPYMASLFLKMNWLLFSSIYLIFVAVGDLLFLMKIIMIPSGSLLEDHANKIGCWVYFPS